MAYSYTTYTVDSTTAVSKTFALGFNYLRTSHITTSVGGTAEEDFTVDDTASTLTFGSTVTLEVGNTVTLTRTTPKTKSTRVVDFTDGSILSQDDLDDSALQLLYISQEAFDVGDDTLGKDTEDGQWDARSLRIKNVAAPSAGTDAARQIDIDAAIFDAGSLPGVTSSDNDSGLFVESGDWEIRTPAQSRTHMGLGTSSLLDSGIASGNVPVLDSGGYPSTISGAQIPNVLAEGLSVAFVRWGAQTAYEKDSGAWVSADSRLVTSVGSAHFLNNGPTTGGTYFTERSDNAGLDLAAGKYWVHIPFLVYNALSESAESEEARLYVWIGTYDYHQANNVEGRHSIAVNGLHCPPATAGGGLHFIGFTSSFYLDLTSGASSLAIFAVNQRNSFSSGGTPDAGQIELYGMHDNNIWATVVRLGD